MCDDSDTDSVSYVPGNRKRRARCIVDDSESSSESDSSIEKVHRRKRVFRVASDDESNTDSSDTISIKIHRNVRKMRSVSSDSNDSTESEDNSDWSSESEASDIERNLQPGPSTVTTEHISTLSDSSDGESEKCPICLVSFSKQEVGTPETCDHSFCAECIQEWSKNINTCPVDRQEFNLILVRRKLNGKVIRRIPVEKKQINDEDGVLEFDQTFCEVCGRSDREDRMLLCDGCDLGYHLECLTPPLDTVPVEEWYCSECSEEGFTAADVFEIYEGEVNDLLEEVEQMGYGTQLRRTRVNEQPRLLPRTRQSERVRARVETHRLERENINDQAQSVDVDQPSTSSGFESIVDAAAGPSTVSATKVKTKNLKRKTVKKNRSKPKKRRKTRYKTVEYEIDEESGAKFSVRKKITKRRRKRKNKRKIRVKRAIPKTVKKRLASQLGICPPQKVGQSLPDVKIKSTSNGIESQRFHAGIPTLHLFGRRDELDYFDESNEEDEFSTAGGVTLASRSRQSLISHRHHRHLKAISLPSPPAASTACDILDSILHSQSKFHSKNSVMSIDCNGAVSLKDTNDNSVIKNSKPDLDSKSIGTGLESNSFDLETSERVTQTPMYPGYNGGGGNRAPYGFNRGNGAGYRGTGSYNSSYGSSGGNYTSGGFYGNGSRGRGANFGSHPFDSRENRAGYIDYLHRGPSPAHRGVPLFQRGRGAPRFPRRPFIGDHSGSSASTYSQDEDVHEIDLSMSVQENEISRSTEPEIDVRDVSVNRDEDFDIYSDIEATPAFDEDGDSRNIDEPVSATPSLLPPPIPPALPGIVYGSDSDDGDSDVDLVIDDADKNEKYDPTKPSGDSDSEPDTTGATSVDCRDASSTEFSKDLIGPKLPDDMKTLLENNSDLAVAGTARPRIVLLSSPAPTEPENENCPNLSVYTSESGIESRERCATPDEDTDDECPNFSIYSAETLNIAKTTEQEIEAESSKPLTIPLKSDDLTISNDSAVPNDLEGVPEPDSVQNDEVESSTGDFEQIDSQRKSPETTTVIDSAEPDSNNMEEESELAVISQMSPKSKTARAVENSNQIEEISTTQNDIDAESKASRSDSTEIVQSSSVKNRIENILQKTLRLYDDSDLEEWSESNEKSEEEKVEKKLQEDDQNSNRSSIRLESRNVMEEIEKLTEAVSEEERSYTPCMDENGEVEGSRREPGIGGLDTELVSDEEKNDFDESHEIRNASDGEALEINAKEHELDLAVRPDDYEEGEIVEGKKKRMDKNVENSILQTDTEKIERVETEVQTNKDIEERPKEKKKKPTDSSFKKVNKGGKDRNYRDRDREKSKSKERKARDSKKKDARQRKEKRKELERYNVRNVVGQKIARKSFADIFGRDESRERSPSPFGRRSVSRERSSSRRRSVSRSRRSFSRGRRSASRRRSSSRRRRSPSHRSLSRDRSISRSRRSSSRKRRSLSRNRRSASRIRRSLSLSRNRRVRRSRSKSKSISPRRNRPAIRRSRSKTPRTKIKPRRRRSNSKPKTNKRIADDSNKSKKIKKKNRSISPKQREHIAGAPTRGSREPERVRYRREWSPSWSRSPSPRQRRPVTNISPSWTPPVRREGSPIEPQNLTVILTNDEAIKKKKEKRKKGEKRLKENVGDRRKRRRRDETPPPSKEVFASGDNILVSVSFNKTADESVSTQPVREMVATKRKRDISDAEGTKRSRKDKSTRERNKKSDRKGKSKKNKDISNVKPVAIIDLDRSPFKEITPSPKDVIVLSDSDDPAKDVERHESPRDEPIEMGSRDEPSSTPQSPRENGYTNAPTGPKTPPEPQIKFHIQKPQQSLRNVSNPLRDDHDDGSEPEDDEDVDPRPELEIRTAEVVPHKGPNTPPEPPSSPPSSPDAYDPFEPTKSRSPTPEPVSRPTAPPTRDTVVGPDASPIGQIQMTEVIEKDESIFDNTTEASSPKHIGGTPDGSVGTPIRNISVEHERIQNTSTPELPRSTDTNNVNVIDQITQPPAASIFPAVVKPIAATPAYSAVNPTIVCSTPITQNTTASRNNVFGGTPTWGAPTLVPQRVVHPTPSSKPSPAKPSPLKTSPSKGPIKSTPIKPMPSKTIISKLPLPTAKPYNPRSAKNKSNSSKSTGRQSGQNGSEVIDVDLDFDSPYSPGSSDYEDLFEPPTDTVKSNSTSRSNTNQKNSKSPAKGTFDSLFGGGSPVYRPQQSANKKTKQSSATKVPVKYNKKSASKGAKNQVGIKLDEDSLKILDELPSSAVEMQVKDKFLKKLNRQERVVEEVKLVLKPHYNKKHVTKEQYKDILRRSVPKICHNKTGEINPKKIQALIEAYVKRARMTNRKGASNTSTNPSQTQTKPAKSTFWS